MSKFKPGFSLRTLVVVTAVLAIAIAFAAAHVRIMLGFVLAMLWLLEFAGGPIIDFVEAWPELTQRKIAQLPRDDENSLAAEHE